MFSGQNNDNFKIVFPGPTSEDFKLEIPEHCRKIGICEDVPNYPQDLADKAISQVYFYGFKINNNTILKQLKEGSFLLYLAIVISFYLRFLGRNVVYFEL